MLLSSKTRSRNKIKVIQREKEEVKLSLLAGDMII
jgi:hypothetical protein